VDLIRGRFEDLRGTQRTAKLIAAAVVVALAAAACEGGRASGPSSGAHTSSLTVSSLSPPDPTRLTASGCLGSASSAAPRTVGRYTIRIPSGWTDTGDYTHTESLLLELTAPASYGNPPSRIQFLALPYDVQRDFGTSTTAHSIAVNEAKTHQHFTSPLSAATSVADCSVAGEPAAVFGYADGNERGYWLLFIHDNGLLGVRLFGTGGIGDQAIQEALSMIGSITWTV